MNNCLVFYLAVVIHLRRCLPSVARPGLAAVFVSGKLLLSPRSGSASVSLAQNPAALFRQRAMRWGDESWQLPEGWVPRAVMWMPGQGPNRRGRWCPDGQLSLCTPQLPNGIFRGSQLRQQLPRRGETAGNLFLRPLAARTGQLDIRCSEACRKRLGKTLGALSSKGWRCSVHGDGDDVPHEASLCCV